MRNTVQSALPHPDNSWSPKRSPKILNSNMIHANKIVNQKMDPTTLQKSMSDLSPSALCTPHWRDAAADGATVPRSPPTGITRVGRGHLSHARPPCSATSVSSTGERTGPSRGVQVSVHESLLLIWSSTQSAGEIAAVLVKLAVRAAGGGALRERLPWAARLL